MVKCLLQRCCLHSGVVHGLPSSSSIVTDLEGTSPLRLCCMSLMHRHTNLPPNLPFCSSFALDSYHWFLAPRTAWRQALLALRNLERYQHVLWLATSCTCCFCTRTHTHTRTHTLKTRLCYRPQESISLLDQQLRLIMTSPYNDFLRLYMYM